MLLPGHEGLDTLRRFGVESTARPKAPPTGKRGRIRRRSVRTFFAMRRKKILLDVLMPELDGPGALAALRSHPATRDIPVIMVSTRSGAGHMETSFTRGCNDYVTKPVNSAELSSKVRACLEGRA